MADYRNVAAAQPYRGIRNNNPGNLGNCPVGWVGEVGCDGNFSIFTDSVYGLRALAINIGNSIIKDGNTTITAVITQYAPPAQNDTASYIQSVAGDTGLDPSATIPLDTTTLANLIRAIINHEEGDGPSQQFVSDADIAQGISEMNTPLLNAFSASGGTPPPSPDPASTALLILIGVVAVSAFLNR